MAKRLGLFLTDVMYTILKELSSSKSLGLSLVLRSRMILLAWERFNNTAIAEQLEVERHCVGRWRKRWQQSFEALLSIQLNEPHSRLRQTIMDVLSDAYRSGAPGKFTSEQIVQLISLACESPRDSGRPVDNWTGRELADEMQMRSIVDSISRSWVNELLRKVELKPHQRKGWCFTTEKDQERFQEQVEEVCQTYLNASAAFQENHTRTISVDEMTSLQANEHRRKVKRPKPGQIGKQECQYTRHGTLSLTGSWDVVLGQMILTTIDETRNNDDFAKHMGRTFDLDPDANWVVVLDNLNTHCGEPIVRLVAERLGIDQDSLGKAKQHGILATMKSRRKFLTDPTHRIRFVFTPKHSSWLNQIEIVFGILGRRVMRTGSFTSREDLRQKLTEFIEYYNQTFAKPFQWTFTGKPTEKTNRRRPKTWREKRQATKIEQVLALVA